MTRAIVMTPLKLLLQPISRPENVDAEKIYNILGAHWYATGLYTKETKAGSSIQADKLYRVEEGDFVYNRLFAWKGSFAIADSKNHNCYVSNEFPTFKIDQKKIDARYLWNYFSRQSAWSDALGLSTGSTPTSRNRLKEENLLAMDIPLPPLEEQHRIVARIEELAAKIEEAQGLREGIIEETESLIISQARILIQSSNGPKIELGQLLDQNRDGIQTGPFGAQLSSADFIDEGVPVLTIGNIQYTGLQLDYLKHVSFEKAQELKRFAVKQGDILFARMGTVGRCCIVPVEAEDWLINYHIIRVALDTAKVDHRYIYWNIRASLDVKQYLEEKIRGATRQGVNTSIVSSLPMRIPSLSEQKQIVTHLDKLQSNISFLKQNQSEASAELDALLPSILNKAFKGEL